MPDLRGKSPAGLVEYVFGRPAREADGGEYDELKVDPTAAVAALRWIAAHQDEIARGYTPAQVEQAFRYLFGEAQLEFSEQLWNPAVPWQERRACIRELATLYDGLFREIEMDGVPFMLWDMIGFGYDCGTRHPTTDAEDARVQQAIFETLSEQLESRDPEIQLAALHGLGHLCHADGNERVSAFLSQGDWMEPEVRQYAEKVLVGSIL
jgi:hypothetical protein